MTESLQKISGADGASQAELERLIGRVLTRAKENGASQAEAGVSSETGLSVTVRLGEVETIEYHRDRGLVVTVYFDACKGSASTADLSPQAVEEAVAKACSIARYTASDPCTGLAPAERMAGELPDLDLDYPWSLGPDDAIALATECEQAARDYDERIVNSEGATVSSHRRLQVYGNSHGLIAGYPTTYHSVSCAVVGKDDSGMQRDYWYTNARDPLDLKPAASVGERAAQRTVRRLGARQMATTSAPVIMPASLARGLIGHFLRAIQGGSQYRKTSFLLDAAGESVFPEFVTICERPHLLKGVGSTAMDSEGVATRDRDLVTAGVLQGYILSSYSARRLGLETTGNAGGVHNVIVSGDEALDEASLIADTSRGFLVTELIGHGVNPTTGDYSRGAAGFWIENGEIAYPVHEVTIAGNLRDMYRDLEVIAGDADPQGNVRCGSLRLAPLTIAGS